MAENITVMTMWHFVAGVSQPPAKKKKTSEAQTGTVAYESKRNRTILSSWQKERPWLVFMPEGTKVLKLHTILTPHVLS